jgi:signal transduction histidine kinase
MPNELPPDLGLKGTVNKKRQRGWVRAWWRGVLSFYPQKPTSLAWFKTRPRFYQQLLVLLIVAVLTPLAILSVWLYDINDGALRRQMNQVVSQFHRNTLNDVQTDLYWLEQQAAQSAKIIAVLERHNHTQGQLPTAAQLNQWLRVLPTDTQTLLACTALHGDSTNLAVAGQWASKLPVNAGVLSSLCQHSAEGFSKNDALPVAWLLPKEPLAPTIQRSQLTSSTITLRGVQLAYATPQVGSSYTLVQLIKPVTLHRKLQTYQQQWAGALTVYNRETQQFVGSNQQAVLLPFQVQQKIQKLSVGQTEIFQWEDAHHSEEQKRSIIATKLRIQPWVLLLEVARYANKSSIDQARIKTFILIGVSFTVSMVLGLLYIFGIIRNFRQLIKGIKAMAQGNYNRRIRLIRNWATPFEIIYVTGEFNRMGRRISEQWNTIQQANQALAKLDELKSNLIDTVSHELRTPLMNIQGYTSQLLRHNQVFSAEQRTKNLKTIRQQTKRLERLVEDLLVIPDLERHALRIYPEPLYLQPLVEQTIGLFAENKQERLMVEWALPTADTVQVLADATRLEQVLVNLIENAFKYTALPEVDTVRLIISQLPKTLPLQGSWVQFSVENACEPMPESVLQSLFEKFKRLDESLTRTTRGSGLGLYIAKALTEAMEGEIGLAYHPDRGVFEAFVRLSVVKPLTADA